MASLVDVRCPACGAPMRIDPRAPFATCSHCRSQSRVERVTSAADLGTPSGEPVIRVMVRSGARLVITTLAITAVLVLALFVGLAVSYFAPSSQDALASEAVFVVDLSERPARLEDHVAVVVLGDDSVVVGSSSGRLMLLDGKGETQENLDLPLPAPRSRLAGLAADGAQGFFASLGGGILRVSAGVAGPVLPADASLRNYGAIASNSRGELHAITSTGELARVGPDGLAVHSVPLGLPADVKPLDVRGLAFAPDRRALIVEPLSARIWWVDPGRGGATLIATKWDRVASTVAFLPDGSFVFDSGRELQRVRADGATTRLSLERPTWLEFQALASDSRGGLVALSGTGHLVRYDAKTLGPFTAR